MFNKVKLKPSKPISLVGLIMSIFFVVIAFIAIPRELGLIRLLFILFAIGIAMFHAINLFSNKGISFLEFDFDGKEQQKSLDFETKLRKLDNLYKDGLIGKEEYQLKREEIMNQKW